LHISRLYGIIIIFIAKYARLPVNFILQQQLHIA